jgi:uncharacterized membrane protein
MVDGAVAARAPTALCSDGLRSSVAMAGGFALPVAAAMVMAFTSPPGGDWAATAVVLILVAWNLYIVIYVVLTMRVFGKVDGAEFADRIAARTARRGSVFRRFQPWGDGPTFTILSVLVAFVMVLALPHIKAIDLNDWLLAPVSISILLSSWGLTVISYALHYAQHDLAQSGLNFPGDRTNAYADYLYFAVAVSTTLGATDVSVNTPHMRRIVNLHTVLTFVFNSVIVALLVAVLVR